jgi:ribosomal protein L11 methyltransferase
MEYVELELKLEPFTPWNEVLVALLSEIDFESFQEIDSKLMAYIQKDLFRKETLDEVLNDLKNQPDLTLSTQINFIEQQNWNAVWESQFEPVFVDDHLQILAPFHESKEFKGQTIIIEPKMSFGTGHHQTTFLMCKEMFELDFENVKVLDMGSGTGVLAILAEKLGASEIHAFDIEPWSVENCEDNSIKNQCIRIKSFLGDIDKVNGSFDYILANINKNVLKNHMKHYAEMLRASGILLLSGFFQSDTEELKDFASNNSLTFIHMKEKEGWAMLKFKKD